MNPKEIFCNTGNILKSLHNFRLGKQFSLHSPIKPKIDIVISGKFS